MKVLIAEDDAVTRKLLERKLTEWKFEVESASDGNEAWDRLQAEDAPKLAVLDWMMPLLDGVDVCRRLRKMNPSIPTYVILLTVRSEKQDIVEGLEAGADDYMVKPFDQEELRARINVGRRMIELRTSLAEKEKLEGALEMAGAVCHELNQPLQVISGISELLLLDQPKEGETYAKLKTLEEHVERVGKITRKLMQVTSYRTKEHLKTKIIDIDKSIK